MGCDEIKSPILFFLVHRLKILQKQIWKSNNFADGMDHNRNDHDDWFWSLFDNTWNIAGTHNLLTILYSFCIIF